MCVFFQKNVVFHNRHNLHHPLVLPQDNHCVICLLTVCVLAFVFIFLQTCVILVLVRCLPLQELSEFILLTSFHRHFSHCHFLYLFLPQARSLGQLCIYLSVCSFVPFPCRTHKHAHTGVLLSVVEISQSIRESTFSVIKDRMKELFFTRWSIYLS